MTYQEEFIIFTARAGVFTFEDFTTKPGRRTPYFTNTGNCRTGAQAAEPGGYYAAYTQQNLSDGMNCLFGPVYKSIPLAVSATTFLYHSYGWDPPYYFNCKEARDHGRGGVMVDYKPQGGDWVVVTEDVATAGTVTRGFIGLLQHVANVKMRALIVSVDRMGRDTRACSTLDEPWEDYGIAVYPIVTVREIIAFLRNREFGGGVYIDDEMGDRVEAYLE